MVDNLEALMPFKSVRKLANFLRAEPTLNQNKELQNKIISVIQEILVDARTEWCKKRAVSIDAVIKVHQRSKASKGAMSRDSKYKKFREKFADVQKDYFMKAHQNNQNLTANSFVDWFLINKPREMTIPYVEHNQKNKLRQLAQANNREFKKLLLGKS